MILEFGYHAYDPYGRPRVMRAAGDDGHWLTEDAATYTVSAPLIGNPLMFTARRWDNLTGLYYYRFRDYAPVLGRFMQCDPMKYIDTMNMYAYCGNNPVNYIDPWGLEDKGLWDTCSSYEDFLDTWPAGPTLFSPGYSFE